MRGDWRRREERYFNSDAIPFSSASGYETLKLRKLKNSRESVSLEKYMPNEKIYQICRISKLHFFPERGKK